MPIPTFTKMGPNPSFGDIVSKINTLVGELTNLMLNLDSLNVVEINAGTLVIYDLDGGSGTIRINKDGMVVNNGSFDTFIVDINGNVTMTSALIQSATGYPKVVIDPATELLGAYATATKFVAIEANPNLLGAPMVNLHFEGDETWLTQVGATCFLYGPTNDFIADFDEINFSADISFNGGATLGIASIPPAADPTEAVTRLNQLLAVLSVSNILA